MCVLITVEEVVALGPPGAAPRTAARWRQASRLRVWGVWITGDSRTRPPQGWRTREVPFSGHRGVLLQPRDLSPRVRGPASVVTICSRGSSVTAREQGAVYPMGQQVTAQLCPELLRPSGLGDPMRPQVTTQKLRVIRRQKLRLRLLRATSAASWKTAWTFSWSRAEHSR